MHQKSSFELLEDALLGEDGFLIKLRMLDGFDEHKYSEVCSILRNCIEDCKARNELPKKWVSLLVEICPAILIYIDNDVYCRNNKDWNIKIWDAYLKIYDMILECV